MPRKRILSICRTCREPKPRFAFRRYNDEIRSRHDSCIECEDRQKKLDAMKRPRVTANKIEYNRLRYLRLKGETTENKQIEIKTKWVKI